MNRQDYFEKYTQIIRDEWFKNHRAVAAAPVGTMPSLCASKPAFPITVKLIEWGKPDSSIYYVRYILSGPVLFVAGDLGESVYRWSETITPAFIANTDFGYFYEKCTASEMGRALYCWSPTLAKARAAELIEQCHSLPKRMVDILRAMPYGTEYDCQEALSELIRKGFDSTDAAGILEAGKPPHPRAIGHWLGFKMAFKQLATPLLETKA